MADIVKAGGRCLIPVFATGTVFMLVLWMSVNVWLCSGRAQELLLILDEFWQSRVRSY